MKVVLHLKKSVNLCLFHFSCNMCIHFCKLINEFRAFSLQLFALFNSYTHWSHLTLHLVGILFMSSSPSITVTWRRSGFFKIAYGHCIVHYKSANIFVFCFCAKSSPLCLFFVNHVYQSSLSFVPMPNTTHCTCI